MKHKIKCSHCSQSVRVPHEKVGTLVRCPVCRDVFLAEAPDDALPSNHAAIVTIARAREDTLGLADLAEMPEEFVPDMNDPGAKVRFIKTNKHKVDNTVTGLTRIQTEQSIGRFILKRELGEGGFGKVYEAFDPQLQRTVALKIPTFRADSKRRLRRFTTEAQSAAKLHHPNIVAVFENGQTAEGQLYIASEFVDGSTMKTVIANYDIPLREKIGWIRDLANALHYAHVEGVIHRDIKPENILIERVQRRPKIVDFGLAKILEDNDRHEGQQKTQDGVLGTPAFMAPEQARGELDQVGPQSDQYSLGAVLYQCLTGKQPFSGTVYVIIAAVAGLEEPERILKIVPDIPKDLVAICEKSMCKNASGRYAQIDHLGDDLQRWLDDRPVLARPVSRITKFVRSCRRNPVVTALYSVLALTLIGSTLVLKGALSQAIQQGIQASKNADLAEQRAAEAEAANVQVETSSKEAEKQARLAREKELQATLALTEAEKARQTADTAKERAEKSLAQLAKETERATSAEESKSQALAVQNKLKLDSLRERANTEYAKGDSLLEAEPVHGLFWFVRALETIASIEENNEAIVRFEEMVRKRIATVLATVPHLTSVIRLAPEIASPNRVAFSSDRRLVAALSGKLSVRSIDSGAELFSSKPFNTGAAAENELAGNSSHEFGNRYCNGMLFFDNNSKVTLFRGAVGVIEVTPNRREARSFKSNIDVYSLNKNGEAKSQTLLPVPVQDAFSEPVTWLHPVQVSAGIAYVARGVRADSSEFSQLMYLDSNAGIQQGPVIESFSPVTAMISRPLSGDLIVGTGATIRRVSIANRFQSVIAECGNEITGLAVDAAETRIAASLSSGEVRVYQTADLQFFSLSHDGAHVTSMEFSTDGSKFFTASTDRLVRVWSTIDGKIQGAALQHPESVIKLLSFGPRLTTVCQDGCLRHWLLPKVSKSVVLQGKPHLAAFAPRENQVVALYFERSGVSYMIQTDLVSGTSRTFRTNLRFVPTDLEFSPDGRRLLVASGNTIDVFSLERPEQQDPLSLPFKTIVSAVGQPAVIHQIAVSDQAKVVACVLTDGQVFVWPNRADGRPKKVEIDNCSAIAIQRTGEQIAMGTSAGRILLADGKGQIANTTYSLSDDPITALRFSGDGSQLAAGTRSSVTGIFTLLQDELLKRFQLAGDQEVVELRFLSEDRELAAISHKSISVWNVQNSSQIFQSGTDNSQERIAVSSSGEYLLQGTRLTNLTRTSVLDATSMRQELEDKSGMRLTDDGLFEFTSTPN